MGRAGNWRSPGARRARSGGVESSTKAGEHGYLKAPQSRRVAPDCPVVPHKIQYAVLDHFVTEPTHSPRFESEACSRLGAGRGDERPGFVGHKGPDYLRGAGDRGRGYRSSTRR